MKSATVVQDLITLDSDSDDAENADCVMAKICKPKTTSDKEPEESNPGMRFTKTEPIISAAANYKKKWIFQPRTPHVNNTSRKRRGEQRREQSGEQTCQENLVEELPIGQPKSAFKKAKPQGNDSAIVHEMACQIVCRPITANADLSDTSSTTFSSHQQTQQIVGRTATSASVAPPSDNNNRLNLTASPFDLPTPTPNSRTEEAEAAVPSSGQQNSSDGGNVGDQQQITAVGTEIQSTTILSQSSSCPSIIDSTQQILNSTINVFDHQIPAAQQRQLSDYVENGISTGINSSTNKIGNNLTTKNISDLVVDVVNNIAKSAACLKAVSKEINGNFDRTSELQQQNGIEQIQIPVHQAINTTTVVNNIGTAQLIGNCRTNGGNGSNQQQNPHGNLQNNSELLYQQQQNRTTTIEGPQQQQQEVMKQYEQFVLWQQQHYFFNNNNCINSSTTNTQQTVHHSTPIMGTTMLNNNNNTQQQQIFANAYQQQNPFLVCSNNNPNPNATALMWRNSWEQYQQQQYQQFQQLLEKQIQQKVDERIRILNTAIEYRLAEFSAEFGAKVKQVAAELINTKMTELIELQKKINEQAKANGGQIQLTSNKQRNSTNNEHGANKSNNFLATNNQQQPVSPTTTSHAASSSLSSTTTANQQPNTINIAPQQQQFGPSPAVIPAQQSLPTTITSALLSAHPSSSTNNNNKSINAAEQPPAAKVQNCVRDDDVQFVDFVDRQKWLPRMRKEWEMKVEQQPDESAVITLGGDEVDEPGGIARTRQPVNVKIEPHEAAVPDGKNVVSSGNMQNGVVDHNVAGGPVTPPPPPQMMATMKRKKMSGVTKV